MAEKTREVYKETAQNLTELNPFVDMPRMRVDEVIKLNELIKRDKAMPIAETDEDCGLDCCGACQGWTSSTNEFCPRCGQRLDHENIAF